MMFAADGCSEWRSDSRFGRPARSWCCRWRAAARLRLDTPRSAYSSRWSFGAPPWVRPIRSFTGRCTRASKAHRNARKSDRRQPLRARRTRAAAADQASTRSASRPTAALRSSTRSSLSHGKNSPSGFAAEVAVSRGRTVDRLVQPEISADSARREAAELVDAADCLLQLVVRDDSRSVRVDVERERLGDADRISELDGAAARQACRDDVLGEVPRGISGRAVDLGRVLARECAAAVRGRAAVRVDDDLAPGDPGVAFRAADLEAAGRVDVIDGPLVEHAFGEDARDDRFHVSVKLGLLLALIVARLCAGSRRRWPWPQPACRSRSAR